MASCVNQLDLRYIIQSYSLFSIPNSFPASRILEKTCWHHAWILYRIRWYCILYIHVFSFFSVCPILLVKHAFIIFNAMLSTPETERLETYYLLVWLILFYISSVLKLTPQSQQLVHWYYLVVLPQKMWYAVYAVSLMEHQYCFIAKVYVCLWNVNFIWKTHWCVSYTKRYQYPAGIRTNCIQHWLLHVYDYYLIGCTRICVIDLCFWLYWLIVDIESTLARSLFRDL